MKLSPGAFATKSALCIAFVLLVGTIKLAEPLGGDQSLFLVGAHALHDGAVLYRDFWDLKQPGIYAFYFIATTFGPYSALTIHAFELLYLTSFAIVLSGTMRHSPVFVRVAPFAPLGAIAFYYLAASSFEAIQVESLIAFPLVVALTSFVSGSTAAQPAGKVVRFLVGGCASAIVLAFKLIFLPLVAAMLGVALAFEGRRARPTLKSLGTSLSAALVGFAVPSAAILSFFAMHGTVDAALQTWFVLPPEIVKFVPHEPTSVLIAGLRWFLHRYAAMLVLAGFGLFLALRRGIDAVGIGLIVWIVVGTALILAQVTSWFQYQWLLLSTPIGLFAVLGACGLYDLARERRYHPVVRLVGATAFVVGVIVFPGALFARDTVALARHGFALNASDREAYRDSQSFVYASLRADARYVPGDGGTLYVIGDPTFYVVTDRLQPIALNGSSVRLFLPDQWTTLSRELAAAKPKYLYRSHGVRIASDSLSKWLDATFKLRHRGELGDLFERADSSGTRAFGSTRSRSEGSVLRRLPHLHSRRVVLSAVSSNAFLLDLKEHGYT